MTQYIAIAAALLPALILFLYTWKSDPHKEPFRPMCKAFLLGVAICLPVATVEQYVQEYLFGPGGSASTLFGSTVEAFFVAALPEESAKLLALWLVLRRNRYFDEYFDAIVYAVCVGLGFAAVENVFYVLGDENWFSVAVTRAFLAVPGHYAFAVLMGYYYAMNHFVKRSPRNAVRILLVPVLAHGVYDAIALSGSVSPLMGGISFFVLVFFCIKMHKNANAKMTQLIARDMSDGHDTL